MGTCHTGYSSDICYILRYAVSPIHHSVLNCISEVQVLSEKRVPVPEHTTFKPYMDYTCITDTSSKQYELISQAEHSSDGLLRYDGCICVALGSKWGDIGTKYRAKIGGKEYLLIKADEKQARHTLNGEGWVATNSSLLEVIIDDDVIDYEILYSGSVDKLMSGYVEEMRIIND